MHERGFAVVAAAAAVFLVAITQAQTPDAAAPPWSRVTPDGQPDLQGTWVNFDSTPFEADMAGPTGACAVR